MIAYVSEFVYNFIKNDLCDVSWNFKCNVCKPH